MTQNIYRMRPQRQSSIPNVIFALLIANGLMYAMQLQLSRSVWGGLALWPLDSPNPAFMPWQLVTYGFLHAPDDPLHIAFNMLVLWMFGRAIENFMGPRRFIIYYLSCVVGAGIVQLTVAKLMGEVYPTIGASGGVFGILLAYGMTFPNRTVVLPIPPIPMKAKYFVLGFGLMELYLGVSGRAPGVANFAHLGGMLFGFALIQYWRSAGRRR
ncbi:MAG: rhomboid family intramembrane serine protease [Woeseiaceae bacterium]|nr:rhomboid family intramembrane serine protease [Woeseiaceae bacterium]